ncbi:MAG TPA: Asp-tRNA(Asn)/Glu-tRNA(Gln) amidotransferase subunit GatC [Patescibacteria group bacterium]|nr:Asp-tRNA(Asn)/Glu-tRNA(Gln) amidotransferase subunit GatC [Patescibacteria group bacterium]
MTTIDVKHIAKLAELPLTQEEEKKFKKQLSAILEHIEKLSSVDISQVAETSQVTGLENVDREDSASASFSQEEATSQAKIKHNGLFEVPVILEEAVE